MNFEELPGPEKEAGEMVPHPDTDTPLEPQKNALQTILQREYWAVKPTKDCVDSLIKKANIYYNYVNATGKLAMWRMSFEQYNRGFLTMASISRGGIEGELIHFPVNEFRNALQQKLTLTTKEKVAWEPQPTNSDYKTGAQITLSRNILNYYGKHKNASKMGVTGAEHALIFGEGHLLELWNENLGDIENVDVGAQKIYKKGDIQFISLNPTDVIRDIHIGNFDYNDWFIIRLYVNKYELAVQYPDKAQEIVSRGVSTDWDNTNLTNSMKSDSDLVPMFLFFHKQTTALPFGRQIFYLDQDVVLEDGHLKYRDFPLKTIIPSPVDSINFGYTVAFDLLPLQQVADILYSAIATNNTNFATTNIIIPENCNLGVADIIGGMNLLKYNPQSGKPEALNLVLTPKEVYSFLEQVVNKMYMLAGLNSVQQGNPEANLKSGAAIALVDMKALQFNSTFQQSYVSFMENVGTGILHLLQDFADTPRLAVIAGEVDKSYLSEFSGKDLEGIDRVLISMGSAFAQTDAGRLQMAQDLIASGLMKDPQEYMEVVETGSLSRLTEGQHMSLMLIKKENEALSNGQKVLALATDDHVTHILEHNNVIANPELRNSQDPQAGQIVQNTLAHIQEHIQMLSTLPPVLAAILKLPVLNQPQAPTGNGAGNGANAPKPAGPQAGGAPSVSAPAPATPQGTNQ